MVHVTTPPSSHYALASDALDAGAHAIVEKPFTENLEQTRSLVGRFEQAQRVVVEDHSYVFSPAVQEILAAVRAGHLGEIVHAEVVGCIDVADPHSPYSDPNLRHPMLELPGGAIADYLPHMASLLIAFVGPHCTLQASWARRREGSHAFPDEMRALVRAARGSGLLLFSSSRPDALLVNIIGTKGRASADVFEARVSFQRASSRIPKPLVPFVIGLGEARASGRAAATGVWKRLSGSPPVFDGLRELLRRTYRALAEGDAPPVSAADILAVGELVHDLTAEVASGGAAPHTPDALGLG